MMTCSKSVRVYAAFAVALLGGAMAVPALAQEGDAVPKTFRGTHVEALIGYDRVSSGIDGASGSIDGLSYGAGFGHDFQFDRMVIGFGSEYAGTTTDLRERSATRSTYLRPGGDFYIGGRFGYVAAPRTMVYVKGGFTSTRLRFQSDDTLNPTYEDRPKVSGYRIGLGVEQKLSRGAFVEAEYRYSNYDTVTVTDPAGVTFSRNIDLDRSQLTLGVGFRF